ncbi:hypothetical protein CNEO4_190019 [Clostridium neonatale]|uniref:Uncharacterized protein n=1 Tax=Clostridium neonatale TaxID=137838 RepID=A0AA86JIV0_9CLOT|nr:hypothetical protein CNEO_43551 [Clostridium neonatale]CAG9713699.1 hypothetical protein CNEO_580008 [Clostridium neonatale]CAI3537320.1 hypothetical protein CNEO4_130003 [Clostridium neonatale]CAI3558579.1 hypothetical protein CNEO4_110016 [Clostridium neonatale]CAI3564259.1 hypothetical protein CNEO4_130008 [Clostridium neonatale]
MSPDAVDSLDDDSDFESDGDDDVLPQDIKVIDISTPKTKLNTLFFIK